MGEENKEEEERRKKKELDSSTAQWHGDRGPRARYRTSKSFVV